MTFRSPFCLLLLASAMLSATAFSSADEQAGAWLETEASIIEQVEAEHAAGEDAALRGGITAIHGLIRRQVLNGDYSDLPPQDAPNGPEFGYSVAIDGDWLAVGAPGTVWTHGAWGTAAHGAVFVFQRNGDTWSLNQRLLRANGTAGSQSGSRCGHAVALRLPHLVFGCPEMGPFEGDERVGQIYTFRLTGAAFNGIATVAGPTDGGRCGAALALSANYLAIGCPSGGSHPGQVRIVRRSDGVDQFPIAVPQAVLNPGANVFGFGWSLALREPATFFIGEPGYPRLAIGAPNTVYAGSIWPRGSAFVYQRAADTTWSQSVVLRPVSPGSDGAEFARYGEAVAMNRNQLLVGAPNNPFGSVTTQPGPGTANRYVLTEGMGDWSWQATEFSVPVNLPSGPHHEQRFGAALALGFDNLIAVGAPGTASTSGVRPEVGLSEIRRNASAGWGLHAYWGELRPAGDTPTHNNARFGTSLAFDVAGRTLAVGAPGLRILSGPFAPRGQVWLYTEDYLFDNDFECAAGLPGC